jgi:lipopolysaccharide transport system permease protein
MSEVVKPSGPGTESLWAYMRPGVLLGQLYHRRELLWQFSARQVAERYRGSSMGLLWALVTPLAMLAIYTFVFTVIFDARGPAQPTGNLRMNFALMLFTGLIVFNVFSECATQSPYLIVRNPNYVKKVVFPLEILPASLVASAFVHSLMSLSILLVALVALAGGVPWTALLLPLYYLPLIVLMLAMAWMLASLGVFLRDTGHVMVVIVQVLMFLTPIFYDEKLIPESLLPYYQLNPLTIIVNGFRRCLLLGELPDWPRWGALCVVSVLALFGAYAWFMKIKRGFADVI